MGLEIALSCDIRIASDKARFSLPQVAEGRIPTDGGTQRLPRIIGRGKALELLLTGETITAAEAFKIGLVSRVVPPDALAGEVAKLAETIAAKGPIALRYLKEAVIKGMDMTLRAGTYAWKPTSIFSCTPRPTARKALNLSWKREPRNTRVSDIYCHPDESRLCRDEEGFS